MPAELPLATEAERALSSRQDGDGFDTEVARFFGADVIGVIEDDAQPTDIDSADLGRSARDRAQRRADTPPVRLGR